MEDNSNIVMVPPGCHRALALDALCHASNSHWLPTLHMVIYKFQRYSLKSCHPLLIPPSPKACSIPPTAARVSLFSSLHPHNTLPGPGSQSTEKCYTCTGVGLQPCDGPTCTGSAGRGGEGGSPRLRSGALPTWRSVPPGALTLKEACCSMCRSSCGFWAAV